jgi:hypothetical protein
LVDTSGKAQRLLPEIENRLLNVHLWPDSLTENAASWDILAAHKCHLE